MLTMYQKLRLDRVYDIDVVSNKIIKAYNLLLLGIRREF